MCIHQYYNVYSYRRIWVMYTTRRLSKYLKVHPRSGTRTGMSNDDHLLVPVVNIAPDCQYTQENVTCYSNVASVGLHDLANQANQTEECTSCSPIILYMWKRVLTMEFFGQEILGLKIPAHDCHSDDDVSALNNSDSDIFATIEKADFVEFLDDDS